jgi:hypothetical protein
MHTCSVKQPSPVSTHCAGADGVDVGGQVRGPIAQREKRHCERSVSGASEWKENVVWVRTFIDSESDCLPAAKRGRTFGMTCMFGVGLERLNG